MTVATSSIPTITDEVIVLDALRRADAEALVAMDDEAIRRVARAEDADLDTPLSLAAATAFIEDQATAWDEEGPLRAFGIRHDTSLVGVAIARLEHGGWLATIEVRIAPTDRRQGFGSRAARLVADYAVDVLGASRLRIDADEANRPAQAMAESLGFKELDKPPFGQPGRRYYGLTHEEWETRSRELADALGEGLIA